MNEFRRTFGKLAKNRLAMISLIVFLLISFLSVFAPLISPHSPEKTNSGAIFVKPCLEYPMGTDNLGRCLFSRILYGGRITLIVGIVTVAISMTIGSTIGLVSGFYRGRIDRIISSLMDAIWAFPTIILALAITAALGSGLVNVIIAIGIVFVPAFARVVRSMVLSIREMEYVQSAKVAGLNDFKIIWRYILPNVMPVIIVQASLNAAQAIISEAALSFMGLGIQPPDASWGYMLKVGYPFLWASPELSIFPGLMILLVVLSLNFLGDGLRDALDVRIRLE